MKMRRTIFTALGSCLFLAFVQFAGAIAAAQQVPDPRVADLVQAGKIRLGVHSVMYTKDPQTGETKAASVGIILLDIARALGARIGVDIVLVGHPTIPEMLTCLTTGGCDMGFMGPDPSRTGVDFSPPILQLDYTFLVPAESSIQRIADVDRPGVRIAVVSDHASTLTLSSNTQTRPTGLCRDSGPHFRAPAFRTGGRVCLGPRRASGVFSKAARLAGAGRALRSQSPRHGGSEGSSRAARLHQRIYRTSQGLGIGAAGDRARRLARIQGGTGSRKDELKIHSILLELSRQSFRRWAYVRFGSKADICSATGDVRYGHNRTFSFDQSPHPRTRVELPARQGQDFTHANLPGLETDQHHVAHLLREIPKRQDCNHKQCEDKSRYFHGFVECNIFDVSDMIVCCHWSLHYQKEAEIQFRTLIPKQK